MRSNKASGFCVIDPAAAHPAASVCVFDSRVGSNGIKVEDEYLDSVLGVQASKSPCDILCWGKWMMWILMSKMHLTLRISPLWMSRVDLWSAQFAGECCRFFIVWYQLSTSAISPDSLKVVELCLTSACCFWCFWLVSACKAFVPAQVVEAVALFAPVFTEIYIIFTGTIYTVDVVHIGLCTLAEWWKVVIRKLLASQSISICCHIWYTMRAPSIYKAWNNYILINIYNHMHTFGFCYDPWLHFF